LICKPSLYIIYGVAHTFKHDYMSNTPTNKQREVLRFIRNFMAHNDKSPTFREISDVVGVTVGAIQERLNLLKQKGLVTWTPGEHRSLKLIKPSEIAPTIPTPLVGTISAGEGIAVHEETDPIMMNVPSHMLTGGYKHYCLRVAGFSMTEDGILDSDIIVVRQQSSADNGDAVVAIIKNDPDEKATLKRFYHHGRRIELRPRNQQLRSKFYDPSQIEIRGKFRGLIREGGS